MGTLTVNVNVGLSAELRDLLSAFSSMLGATFTPAAARTVEAVEVKKELAVPTGMVASETAKSELPVEAEAETKPSPEVAAGVELVEGIIPVKGDTYSEVDVRAAIDRTRRRIEGEDYKNHPESEPYKKWHRPLTTWFINTAKMYGADKPSDLPDHESRRRFIDSCERCAIEDDSIVETSAF